MSGVQWWCHVVHVLAQLFSVSNYYWMLAEGCFIYFLLVLTFVQGRTLFIVCHLIGWGALLMQCLLLTRTFELLDNVRYLELESDWSSMISHVTIR